MFKGVELCFPDSNAGDVVTGFWQLCLRCPPLQHPERGHGLGKWQGWGGRWGSLLCSALRQPVLLYTIPFHWLVSEHTLSEWQGASESW